MSDYRRGIRRGALLGFLTSILMGAFVSECTLPRRTDLPTEVLSGGNYAVTIGGETVQLQAVTQTSPEERAEVSLTMVPDGRPGEILWMVTYEPVGRFGFPCLWGASTKHVSRVWFDTNVDGMIDLVRDDAGWKSLAGDREWRRVRVDSMNGQITENGNAMAFDAVAGVWAITGR